MILMRLVIFSSLIFSSLLSNSCRLVASPTPPWYKDPLPKHTLCEEVFLSVNFAPAIASFSSCCLHQKTQQTSIPCTAATLMVLQTSLDTHTLIPCQGKRAPLYSSLLPKKCHTKDSSYCWPSSPLSFQFQRVLLSTEQGWSCKQRVWAQDILGIQSAVHVSLVCPF